MKLQASHALRDIYFNSIMILVKSTCIFHPFQVNSLYVQYLQAMYDWQVNLETYG